MKEIAPDITIEDLVTELPSSVNYLMQKGIKCIACGEPIWGTLESAAKEKGFGEKDVEVFVADLNALRSLPDSAGWKTAGGQEKSW